MLQRCRLGLWKRKPTLQLPSQTAHQRQLQPWSAKQGGLALCASIVCGPQSDQLLQYIVCLAAPHADCTFQLLSTRCLVPAMGSHLPFHFTKVRKSNKHNEASAPFTSCRMCVVQEVMFWSSIQPRKRFETKVIPSLKTTPPGNGQTIFSCPLRFAARCSGITFTCLWNYVRVEGAEEEEEEEPWRRVTISLGFWSKS